MSRFGRLARHRLVPASLTAAGVTLLAAGLLAYGGAAARNVPVDPRASGIAIGSQPLPTILVPTFPPINGSSPPSVAPSAPPIDRVVTRIVVERLGIDLPVIAQPDPSYPSCNVAMYYQDPRLGQPGSNRSIYLYAHARTGMFLPLLTEVRRDSGKGLIDMLVDIYTSDEQHFVYKITAVLPRVPADSHFLDKAVAVKKETLWLQTSTGPGGQYPKLQVVARPVAVEPASPPEIAHPKAHPVDCG